VIERSGWNEFDACVHVLSANETVWRRVEQHVRLDHPFGVEWDAILDGPFYGLSNGEQLLVLAALDLWNGRATEIRSTFGLRALVNGLDSKYVDRVLDGMRILGGRA
jgi:hypothetical protein